jgi:hypothetical protein
MSIEKVRHLLLWCAFINYLFVVVWFLLVVLARQWLYGICGNWFHLSTEQFDRLNFTGMMLYKIGVLLFNVAPLIALFIIE